MQVIRKIKNDCVHSRPKPTLLLDDSGGHHAVKQNYTGRSFDRIHRSFARPFGRSPDSLDRHSVRPSVCPTARPPDRSFKHSSARSRDKELRAREMMPRPSKLCTSAVRALAQPDQPGHPCCPTNTKTISYTKQGRPLRNSRELC